LTTDFEEGHTICRDIPSYLSLRRSDHSHRFCHPRDHQGFLPPVEGGADPL